MAQIGKLGIDILTSNFKNYCKTHVTKDSWSTCTWATRVIKTLKDTVMQIEKAVINDHSLFQKYSENFAFQLFIILQ